VNKIVVDFRKLVDMLILDLAFTKSGTSIMRQKLMLDVKELKEKSGGSRKGCYPGLLNKEI
jgi:hypothetical protein